MFRFVHIADVHLDSPVGCRTEQARCRLRTASYEALRAAVDLTLEREAAALLIAGDLFDDETISFQSERLLCSQFARLDVPVIYVTGNHDPGGRKSRALNISWPDNVHVIADGAPDRVTVQQSGRTVGAVTGIGHRDYQIGDNLIKRLSGSESDVPEVAVVHAWIAGVRSGEWHSKYAPAAEEDLHAGFDYWALGHVHRGQQVGSLPAYYPGNIQGRNSGEVGPRGGLYVEVDQGGAHAEFVQLAPVRWEVVSLNNVRDVVNWDRLSAKVAREFEQVLPGGRGLEWILVVELSGQCPLYKQLMDEDELQEVERGLADEIGVLEVQVRSAVTRPLAVDDYRGGTHPLGAILSVLDQAREDHQMLKSLLPDELARSSVQDRSEYGRRLLRGLDEEAVARMVGDKS